MNIIKFNKLLPAYNHEGFTLAETLIALVVVGIVSAITIPILFANHQEQQTVTNVKKAYSTLSDAFNLAVSKNGQYTSWPIDSQASKWNYKSKVNNLIQNLRTDKIVSGTCTNPNSTNYKYTIREHRNLTDTANASVSNVGGCSFTTYAILTNGWRMSFWRDQYGYDNIFVDINGLKKPNQLGLDTFLFTIDNNKIIPGYPKYQKRSDYRSCSKTGTGADNGGSCSYWIIRHENMDYKYRNISSEW